MKISRNHSNDTKSRDAGLRRFRCNESGVALIEFALILPFLMIIFYGTIELTRYIQMIQKMDNATSALTDLVNRNFNLSNDSLQKIANAAPAMLQPFSSAGVGLIITAIQHDAGTTQPTTKWQRPYFAAPASKISAGKNNRPNLPQLELQERDQVITVELFLVYKPILNIAVTQSLLGLENNSVYRMNVARPRYGAFELEPQ